MKNSSANSTKERVEKSVAYAQHFLQKMLLMRNTFLPFRQAGYCIIHFQAGITLMDSPS